MKRGNCPSLAGLPSRLVRRLIPLVVLGACAPFANAVEARVDAAKVRAPISPYVYGQFVEHAGSLVYGSLWSEALDDRKFYFPVIPKPAAPKDADASARPWRRRSLSAGRWNPIGPAASVVMDRTHALAGEQAPVITLAGKESRGIRQEGVKVEGGLVYRGRLQLSGDPSAKVRVSLVTGAGSEATVETVALGDLGPDYKRFEFELHPSKTGTASLEISGTGEGVFRVGAASLMPANALSGWKPDAVAALKSLRSGVYRFPGGNFVSAHEWRDAIGDPDRRPPLYDPVWHDVQSNDVGTDEFLTLCRLLEVEPYITVSAGLGDAWSAAQYVEYANGAVDTPMGALRAANGHREPYGVKFWGIGNEMWGDYQYGYMPLEHFLFKHNDFARRMRRADPSIVLIACGAMPDTMTGSKQSLKLGKDLVADYFSPADWTGGLLKRCFDNFDLLSDHFYNFGTTHFDLAKGDQVSNDPNEPITDWMRRGANHVRIKYEEYKEYEKRLPQLVEHPKPLNLDEWAYMGGPHPSYPAYAWVFHEMFRFSDLYRMAAHTFATSLLVNEPGKGARLNANGLVFKIYRDHFGALPVEVFGDSPQPKPTAPSGGEQPSVNAGSDTFPLDVVAAWSEDRRTFTVAVLNPTDREQPLKLGVSGLAVTGRGSLWRLASSRPDGANPEISQTPLASLPEDLLLPGLSISIYEFPAKQP